MCVWYLSISIYIYVYICVYIYICIICYVLCIIFTLLLLIIYYISYLIRILFVSCRDVDMLSDFKTGDDDNTNTNNSNSSVNGSVMMVCNQCGHHYDRIFIENKLLAEVSRLNVTYLLQDIRCPKTHKITSRLCTPISELCAPLQLDISQQSIKSQLSLLYHVASYYNFSLLMETIDLYL